MTKTKRFNASLSAIVVLAVMLVVVLAGGATLAYFSDRDSIATDFTVSGPVILNLTDETKAGFTDSAILEYDKLLPGVDLNLPELSATIMQSNTNAWVRARVHIKATLPNTPSIAFAYAKKPADWATVLEDDLEWTADNYAAYYTEVKADLEAQIEAVFSTVFTPIAENWTAGDKYWFYYGAGAHTLVNASAADFKLTFSEADVKDFPTEFTNIYAYAEIELEFEVEAVQEYVQVADYEGITPTLAQLEEFFESIYPSV